MVMYAFTAVDGTRVVFREPRRGDARQFMDLINAVIDEPSSGIMLDRHVDLRDEVRWVVARMEGIKKRRLVMLTAEVDGVIKGNCDVTREGWKKSHRSILGIVLAKDIRGKGIGEALMRRTIDLAEKRLQGLEYIDLSVLGYNERAKSLYSKLGFVKVARIPDAIKEDGKYVDEVLMTRAVPRRKR